MGEHTKGPEKGSAVDATTNHGLSLVPPAEAPLPALARAWKVPDVCAFTGMGKTWVYEATRKGLIPHKKLGSRTRYDPDELRTWWANYGKGH